MPFGRNSKYRVDVTPAKRGKGNPTQSRDDKTPEQRRQAMTWAQRLINIDVSICPQCGGEAKVIASIEDQPIIDKILAHLMKKGALPPPPRVAAGNTGLTRYRLVYVALGFHTSLHGTATEGKVAWRPVALTRPEGQEGSRRGWVQPKILNLDKIEAG